MTVERREGGLRMLMLEESESAISLETLLKLMEEGKMHATKQNNCSMSLLFSESGDKVQVVRNASIARLSYGSLQVAFNLSPSSRYQRPDDSIVAAFVSARLTQIQIQLQLPPVTLYD